MGAVGGDAVRDLEGMGIELEHGDSAKNVAVGIEELVVVDIRMLAENPLAVGAKVGLRRLALDLVAERVLPLVGVGEIELVGEEKNAGDQEGSDQDGNNDAVKADAGGLDGRDFVGALQQSESHQHRQQHAERRGAVKKIGHYIEQIFAHGERRNLIPQDVAEQLEQGEY